MLESGAGNSANDGGAASSRSKLTRMKNAVTPNNKGKSKVGLNGVGVSSTQRNSTSGSGSAASGGARKSSSKVNEARCAAGVIENVCLLGAPLGASAARWERVAKVVHGRIINGYSKSDIILGLVFRAKSLSLSIAGVQKVWMAFVCRFCCMVERRREHSAKLMLESGWSRGVDVCGVISLQFLGTLFLSARTKQTRATVTLLIARACTMHMVCACADVKQQARSCTFFINVLVDELAWPENESFRLLSPGRFPNIVHALGHNRPTK